MSARHDTDQHVTVEDAPTGSSDGADAAAEQATPPSEPRPPRQRSTSRGRSKSGQPRPGTDGQGSGQQASSGADTSGGAAAETDAPEEQPSQDARSSGQRAKQRRSTSGRGHRRDLSWAEMPRTRQRLDGQLLTIRTPGGQLDPLAADALRAVEDDFSLCRQAGPQSEDELREFVVRLGLAGEVAAVTKRLNQLGLSDARRRVLAVTYPALLAGLLVGGQQDDDRSSAKADGQDRHSAERRRRELEAMFEDPRGVVAEVLARLQQDGGPLETFARHLVVGVGERRRLRLQDDDEDGRLDHLVALVRAAL